MRSQNIHNFPQISSNINIAFCFTLSSVRIVLPKDAPGCLAPLEPLRRSSNSMTTVTSPTTATTSSILGRYYQWVSCYDSVVLNVLIPETTRLWQYQVPNQYHATHRTTAPSCSLWSIWNGLKRGPMMTYVPIAKWNREKHRGKASSYQIQPLCMCMSVPGIHMLRQGSSSEIWGRNHIFLWESEGPRLQPEIRAQSHLPGFCCIDRG